MAALDQVLNFYEDKYEILEQWIMRPGNRVDLGEKTNQICRFCGLTTPNVTFKKIAHAIPESLGNKGLTSYYECDACNELFGNGIENDLGNWTKPMRTMARIRGKSGVPTLKKGGDAPGWRIECTNGEFQVESYEDDPIFEIDELNKRVTFKLKRDPYTPVAVLKAFVKIGLTLIPDEEVDKFKHLFAWIRDTDHTRSFTGTYPIIYTFSPGPRPNNLIAAMILRRKPKVTDVPYAYLILTYGNEQFQVPLIPVEDAGSTYSIRPFPAPHSPSVQFGQPCSTALDLTGRTIVRGEVVPIGMGFMIAKKNERERENSENTSVPPSC
ncbi:MULTISPECIES: HNH endonuclease [Brucella/Ochrobactrum group]|jgi:hypothetical protein|uniref:HNH endonuclease n=1 Tax=Ochrobactrum sp. AP1BH01-1 TaxID=2823874 RepID=UPI001B375B61|nr:MULTISPECIES: HNH endonuclease [Brucella/Ochrobactrum group]MBQ0707711.1 HNH endonuclease [Ochrobactrum sp. AP1BH01-1]